MLLILRWKSLIAILRIKWMCSYLSARNCNNFHREKYFSSVSTEAIWDVRYSIESWRFPLHAGLELNSDFLHGFWKLLFSLNQRQHHVYYIIVEPRNKFNKYFERNFSFFLLFHAFSLNIYHLFLSILFLSIYFYLS